MAKRVRRVKKKSKNKQSNIGAEPQYTADVDAAADESSSSKSKSTVDEEKVNRYFVNVQVHKWRSQ